MTLRLQNMMLAMLLVLTTLFVGFGTLSQNPTSGGYQLFERTASGISADIQLASLENFAPPPESASEYANAPNTGAGLPATQFDNWQPPSGYLRNADGTVTHSGSGQVYTPLRDTAGNVRVDGNGNPIFNTQSGGATAQTTLTNPSTSGPTITSPVPNRTVDDLIGGGHRLPSTGGKTTQIQKAGGFDQANVEFDSLGLSEIRDIALPTGGTGRVGKLPDGRNVVVRSDSSDRIVGQVSQPTLEIQNSDGTRIKIRY